ncbi:MAG: fumarylacetoacetase [Maribacter sp.]|jgi:fumarylacetoacetase
MSKANDPTLKSWIEVSADSDFPIQNIPFGVFKKGKGHRVATIIGDQVIDLFELSKREYLTDVDKSVFKQESINDFMALGKKITNKVREQISTIFKKSSRKLKGNEKDRKAILTHISNIELTMPIRVGDYTDFYSSRDHATNVGKMFRDPANALLPNWLHLPVGYHGRSSSIVLSGTPLHRPKGQQMPAGADKPVFGPCKLLDFELEMGFVVGKKTELGQSISMDEAEDHIFGLFLFNDWSARDIQKWEYVPLGPFLGKSFGSSMSPWVVTLEALEPFRSTSPKQNKPKPLPYLKNTEKRNYDINLSVDIVPENGEGKTVCESNFKYMYWNMCQQLVHHTVNGCNVNPGDVCASGTISGPERGSFGSMLEISWKGTMPLDMPDGSQRKFINDHDTVVMKGYGVKDGVRIGFGEVSGKILPAVK